MAVRSLRSMVRMALVTQRNAHVHGSPMLDAVRSRGIHSRITENADGAFTAITVAASSVFAGVWVWMKDTDTSDPSMKTDVVLMGPEDPAMKTDAYLRKKKALEDVKRARESYKEAVVEDMDDDPDMRARFEDWIKEYGRTYKDEAEKGRTSNVALQSLRTGTAKKLDPCVALNLRGAELEAEEGL